ncbi:MAG: 4'-phosphopantetheinyl transferase EntD [bacterium]|jgi:4'-phosphopantetheinyl transferase EntD
MNFSNPLSTLCNFVCEEKISQNDKVHQKEQDISNQFSSKTRKKEFLSGRHVAHIAMSSADFPFLPITQNKDRSPCWPPSVIGSITHSSTLVAAIVAHKNSTLQGVGIDIENLTRKLHPNVFKKILTPWEQTLWNPDHETTTTTRLIFSIKEAIFKCFYPLNQIYLGFQDAEVTDIYHTKQKFKARFLKTPFLPSEKTPIEIYGNFQIKNQHILATISYPCF